MTTYERLLNHNGSYALYLIDSEAEARESGLPETVIQAWVLYHRLMTIHRGFNEWRNSDRKRINSSEVDYYQEELFALNMKAFHSLAKLEMAARAELRRPDTNP
jgi:hypothetical protein